MAKARTVYCMPWEESERGWGIRPDGYSLHLTEEDYREHLDRHWAFYHQQYGNSVPHEYDRPGLKDPYPCVVDEETYQKIKDSKDNSIREFSGPVPKSKVREIYRAG
jgi:hypothetical protein